MAGFRRDGHKLYIFNAPISVKPLPTQYRDGWGITRGFDAKFRPEGGAFDLD